MSGVCGWYGVPIDDAQPTTRFRQLMIAMDTGSAIVGPARADIYWGVGDEAARIAGRFKQHGTFTLLVAVTPAAPN